MNGRENSACSSLLSEGCVISSPNPDMTHYASKATVHTSHLDGMTKFVESSLEPCFGKLTCLTFCSFTHTFESNAEYAVYAYDWYQDTHPLYNIRSARKDTETTMLM